MSSAKHRPTRHRPRGGLMRTAIVGAGPTGLFMAIALARRGHDDEVCVEGGRATGLRVDGARVDFDLVIDASGRNGRIARPYRAPAQGGDCGIAYVSRQYELLPGAEEGPYNSPVGIFAGYDRY